MFRIGGGIQSWTERRNAPDIQRELHRIATAEQTVAERLRSLRQFAGLRQRDVVQYLKLPQDRVSNLERSRVTPTDAEYRTLAELFGVSEDLLRGSE